MQTASSIKIKRRSKTTSRRFLCFAVAGQKKMEAVALLLLGELQGKLGEWQKAMDNFDQALPLFRAAGETQGEVVALSVMGSIHAQLGKPEELLTYYNRVLEVVRAAGSSEAEAAVLAALGRCTLRWVILKRRSRLLKKLC
jgi:tetratricopeptide (TPR) repeat protein